MQRNIAALASSEYDLLVIGGGIFGVCCAWDAALRGLNVALVEKGDFAQATSSNHFKIVHGGIRYLQHFDWQRIRASSRERSALLRIAPHLVYPIPIVLPTYGHGMKGRELLAAGFLAYESITCDRNNGIRDRTRQIPRGSLLSRQEVLSLFPGIERKGLTGGAVFYDGQIYNPPRLALAFLRSAVDRGAQAANYVEACKLLRVGDRVVGIEAEDVLAGDKFPIRAKCVLNATGPWGDDLLRKGLSLPLNPEPVFSRDVALVVRRPPSGRHALGCLIKKKDADAWIDRGGRHLFLVPWRNSTLVGVWHSLYRGSKDQFELLPYELGSYIQEVNQAYPALDLAADDVAMVNAGLILFGGENQQRENHSFGRRSLLVDHFREHRIRGLLTLIGVRATMARGMAEKAVDLALAKLGRKQRKSETAWVPLLGGTTEDFEEFLAHLGRQYGTAISPQALRSLGHNHGSACGNVLDYTKANPEWIQTVGDSTTLKAEVVHAVREEMAQKLADVVFRRTDLGTAGDPGADALFDCAALVAAELGWDRAKTERELEEVGSFLASRGCWRNFNNSGNPQTNFQYNKSVEMRHAI